MICLASTGSANTSMPKTEIEPLSGFKSPVAIRSVVVLPAPGSQKRIKFPGSHPQIQRFDRRAVEAFSKASNVEGEGSRHLSHRCDSHARFISNAA